VQAARNGIAASTGDLIARMDADDLCHPQRLAKQVAFFDARPDVVLVGGAYDLIDEHGRLLTTIRQPADDAALQDICLSGRCPICQPLAMFRRDAYERVGGYRPDFITAEDLDLWLRLGEVGQMACLPDVLLQYRQHAGSISESKQTLMIEHQREICRQAWERRGLIGQYEFKGETPWRATGDADSRHRQLVKYGWWAWSSGQNRTAQSYGWSAVRRRPLDKRSWRLLGCALLKKAPAGRGATT
jgi:GT2 family glycosyltransferase